MRENMIASGLPALGGQSGDTCYYTGTVVSEWEQLINRHLQRLHKAKLRVLFVSLKFLLGPSVCHFHWRIFSSCTGWVITLSSLLNRAAPARLRSWPEPQGPASRCQPHIMSFITVCFIPATLVQRKKVRLFYTQGSVWALKVDCFCSSACSESALLYGVWRCLYIFSLPC